MSDKEYRFEFHDDYVKVTEIEPDYYDDVPSTAPTGRESMGEKLRHMSTAGKIILTLLFDIYGILYRIGSNSTGSVYIGILQIFTFHFFGLFWLIDLISVVVKNDIVVFGMKRY